MSSLGPKGDWANERSARRVQDADERDGIADAVDQCSDPLALGRVQPPHRDLDKTSTRGHSEEPDDQDSRQPVSDGLAAIGSMAPGPVRLMAANAEGHHDRYRSNGDVGDAATDDTQTGEHVEGAGCSADLLPEPPPLRSAVRRPRSYP